MYEHKLKNKSINQIINENNIKGPFSDLLITNMRSSNSKKNLNNNKSPSMNTQNIQLIDEAKKKLLNVNTGDIKSNLNMNVIKDSDDSDNESNGTIATAEPDEPIKSSERTNKPKLPTFQNSEFQYFTNNKKHKPVVNKEESEEDSDDEEVSEEESDDESVASSSTAPSIKQKKPSKREEEKRKQELLVKLLALEKKGVTLTKSYSLKSPLEEIEFEYQTQQYAAEVDASVHFQEKVLMAAVTGLEFLNKKFDPIGAKLDGWSESVMDNITDYEEIFKELHEKYQQKATMPPELRLLVTLVGSGFMFHLTNTLFKSSLPGIGDVLNSNPDIMKNIMGAMGKAMNQQSGLGSSLNPQSSPPSNSQFSQVPSVPSVPSVPTNNQQSQRQVPQMFQQSQQSQQKDISGPSINLSNLMNNFQNMPDKPIMQQAPKYESEDDRFSVASSSGSETSSRLIPVNSLPKNKKGKQGGGKTIKIS